MLLVSIENMYCFKKKYPSDGIKETQYKDPIPQENKQNAEVKLRLNLLHLY